MLLNDSLQSLIQFSVEIIKIYRNYQVNQIFSCMLFKRLKLVVLLLLKGTYTMNKFQLYVAQTPEA